MKKSLSRIRDEENAAEENLEVMERRQQTKEDLWTELEQHISEKRRSGCMNAKIWQMVQSSSSWTENFENDFDELATTFREMGWGDDEMKSRFWCDKEEESHEDDQVPGISLHVVRLVVRSVVQVLSLLMESILVLVTEWISSKDTIKV